MASVRMTIRGKTYEERDYHVFRSAHEKDYGPLIELLRSDEKLLPRHRELLAKILEGSLVRPRHRKAKTLNDLRRKQDIANHAIQLKEEGWPPTAAIVKVAADLHCSEGTVKNALKDHREGERLRAFMAETLEEIKTNLPEGEITKALSEIAYMMLEKVAETYREVGLKLWVRPRIISEEDK